MCLPHESHFSKGCGSVSIPEFEFHALCWFCFISPILSPRPVAGPDSSRSAPLPPAGDSHPGLTPSTLHRALVGQGPSGPDWLATALGFLSGRALATGTALGGFMFNSSSSMKVVAYPPKLWPNWQEPASTRHLADHNGARGGDDDDKTQRWHRRHPAPSSVARRCRCLPRARAPNTHTRTPRLTSTAVVIVLAAAAAAAAAADAARRACTRAWRRGRKREVAAGKYFSKKFCTDESRLREREGGMRVSWEGGRRREAPGRGCCSCD